jgi:FkbM family methyltransferase
MKDVLLLILKFFYQPVKFAANLFGIKLTASYLSSLPPPPVHLDIPFDKEDKNIFSNLPSNIIKGYVSKVHHLHNDTIDFVFNFKEYQDKLYEVYNLLEDELSKQVYFNVIKYRLFSLFPILANSLSPSYTFQKPKYPVPKLAGMKSSNTIGIVEMYYHSQYEIPGVFEVKPGDVVFDVGAYNGDSAMFFDSAVQPSGKVYAFEPSMKMFELLKSTILKNRRSNTVAVNLGFSDKASKIKMLTVNGMGRVISDDEAETFRTINPREGEISEIEITTIDNYMEEWKIGKVDLIKIDIEGLEEPALNGAEKTISVLKPKLAISIYHYAHDLFELPLMMHRFNPDYKLYVRHATSTISDTVLFCV